jgi:hypothetical protein
MRLQFYLPRVYTYTAVPLVLWKGPSKGPIGEREGDDGQSGPYGDGDDLNLASAHGRLVVRWK